VIVVDDALLLGVLASTGPEDLQAAFAAGEIATTGSWYWRLSRALHDTASSGALSRVFSELDPSSQARVLDATVSLPSEITLPSLRRLVPIMIVLDTGRRLNLLTGEALAAAVALDADVAVTTRSPLLDAACQRLGVHVRLF
jgi:hypothetical protein